MLYQEKPVFVESLRRELQELRDAERLRILGGIKRADLLWWSDKLINDPSAALEKDDLIEIPIDDEIGYRVVGVIRRGEEPCLIRPQAYKLLKYICLNWKNEIKLSGRDKGVFLSVTSLYRTPVMQKQLVDNGGNAAPISAHVAGAAIDFDPVGYFCGTERKPVSKKNNKTVEIYEPFYTDKLKEVINKLQSQGFCNYILEKRYDLNGNTVSEEDSCLHVCVNPTAVL